MPPVETISTPSSSQPAREARRCRACPTPTAAPGARAPRPAPRARSTPLGAQVSLSGAMPRAYPSRRRGRSAIGESGAGWRGSRRAARRARTARTACGSSACSSGRSAAEHLLAARARRAARPRAAGSPGPVSTPSSTKWTVTPNTLHAVVERLLDRADAREGRQQRGMDVDHRRREARQEALAEQLHVAREHDQPRAALRRASRRAPRRAPRGRRSRRARTPRSARRARARAPAPARRASSRRPRRSAPRGRGRVSSSACRFVPGPRRARRWEAARPRGAHDSCDATSQRSRRRRGVECDGEGWRGVQVATDRTRTMLTAILITLISSAALGYGAALRRSGAR